MGRAVNIARDTIKGTASDLGTIPRMVYQSIDRGKDYDIGQEYSSPMVDKDYAIKTAANQGDTNTIKSLVGEHPLEEHFRATGLRHPLGRAVPK